ncbi:universal stress protein [Natranaeroarchaeum sulfidigenes]|uniref:Nucleotide-binding protein, UspA family n=1 Tax=Natranaeroarchaeum sulfidigenes TaxID=2784880 RepID=A0A897MPT9_9EURY|nr:universal stress protein [Natranaeroarchaeum sulfidigenes]QSG02577.1 Nucleotide-binding protein, UspA family [Natranaeroarchaeum sulfidigenes]
MIEHVLTPIDGSDEAFAALSYSCSMFPDANHVTFHVINPTMKRYEGHGYDAGWLTTAKREAEEYHETAREIAQQNDVTVTDSVTEQGDPAREIVNYSAEQGIEHIVMGSVGRSSLGNLVVGSVAKTVTRRTPTPVTVVRNIETSEVDPPHDTLVAIDGSEQAYQALEYTLKELPSATVSVLYVVEPSLQLPISDTEAGASGGTAERGENDADVILETAQRRADEHDRTIETASRRGKPSRMILEHVAEHDFDHLVVGHSGQSGWHNILLGSVAETLVFRSPVPVTVVR